MNIFALSGEEEYLAIKSIERDRERLKRDQANITYDPAIDKPNQEFYKYKEERSYWD